MEVPDYTAGFDEVNPIPKIKRRCSKLVQKFLLSYQIDATNVKKSAIE